MMLVVLLSFFKSLSGDDAMKHVLILYFPIIIIIITIFFTLSLISKHPSVYLVDYACCRPPKVLESPSDGFLKHSRINLSSHPESVDFQMKVLARSGLGDETYLPPAICSLPPTPSLEASRNEAELVIYSSLDSLFKKTGLNPHEVDILVLNCSVFAPAPSLTSMIMTKYKLREDVKTFNLSGMGCSAGLISVNLTQDLLKIHPNSNAIVITTEIITLFYYTGKDRSMLLPNCLFRMGGASVLLSNKKCYRKQSKYRLLRVVRTHIGSFDKAYKCIHEVEDSEGKIGISLSRDLASIAGQALKANIHAFALQVLPFTELFFILKNVIKNTVSKRKDAKPYVPNFKRVFKHFCVHAGGRGVINKMQTELGLTWQDMEPSRMTLHRFGNTSSSSLWYELSYLEAKGRMNEGDRIWQIALGSGFKCNSAVWKCNRSIKNSLDGPWFDCIDRYPIHVS
ncbi:hypothetical protein L2E82_43160 [Cichorium intybus]|uniref:Uncharacterized protein n=1 Tax=Cichorium intybus TaxID=13427 RepID=A0ACB8ZN07_CICIN|nr:hypothetical protein L2E82_43160 [Cichorium intybus]